MISGTWGYKPGAPSGVFGITEPTLWRPADVQPTCRQTWPRSFCLIMLGMLESSGAFSEVSGFSAGHPAGLAWAAWSHPSWERPTRRSAFPCLRPSSRPPSRSANGQNPEPRTKPSQPSTLRNSPKRRNESVNLRDTGTDFVQFGTRAVDACPVADVIPVEILTLNLPSLATRIWRSVPVTVSKLIWGSTSNESDSLLNKRSSSARLLSTTKSMSFVERAKPWTLLDIEPTNTWRMPAVCSACATCAICWTWSSGISGWAVKSVVGHFPQAANALAQQTFNLRGRRIRIL